VFAAVKYLLPLARALWARRQAGQALRSQLIGDQRVLDQVLRELGRAAREVNPSEPHLADEMNRVLAEEARVAQANQDLEELAKREADEKTKFEADSTRLRAQLAELEVDIALHDEKLKEKTTEKRRTEAERVRLDGLIRDLERKATASDARAEKADATPPEKGGGPNTAANARDEAANLRKQATSHIAPRDQARDQADALTAPIDELTKKLVELRDKAAQTKRGIADAQRDHKRSLASLTADKGRVEEARAGAEREISQRFVAAGTLVHLQRPAHARYEPLYIRIDELKDSHSTREAMLARLETDRRSFDRPAVQRGLLVVGGGATVLLLGILALIVFVARC
jgi:chromosome segregation ATPase